MLPRSPETEPHHQMQFTVILKTLNRGRLFFYRKLYVWYNPLPKKKKKKKKKVGKSRKTETKQRIFGVLKYSGHFNNPFFYNIILDAMNSTRTPTKRAHKIKRIFYMYFRRLDSVTVLLSSNCESAKKPTSLLLHPPRIGRETLSRHLKDSALRQLVYLKARGKASDKQVSCTGMRST